MAKSALITGAARGIGFGIASALAGDGFDILIDDVLPEEDGKKAVSALAAKGIRAWYCRQDISTTAGRAAIVARARELLPRLDVLVNNAGVAPKVRADILEASEESFDRLISINLKGPYFLTQGIANWMVEGVKADPHYRPMIVNISSCSAYTSSPGRGEYCISKAGISMMTKLYADRLSEHEIPVYEIRPGIIATDMTATVKGKYDALIAQGLLPFKRWGTPEDIAAAVRALAAGALPYSTGEAINVDGGFHLRRL